MPDNIAPIIIGDSGLSILLNQILLHLIYTWCQRTTLSYVLKLLIDNWIQLVISAWISIIRYLQCSIRLIVLIQIEVYTYAISTAFLLTYRVSICNREATLQEVKFQITLWREWYISRQIDADISQRCSLFLTEFVNRCTAHNLWNVILVGLLMLISSRQNSQILTEKTAKLLLIVVTNNNCLEVGSIAEALLVYLEDAVIVSLVNHLLCDRFHTWMMAIEDGADRVVVIYLWRGIAIGQESVLTIHQACKCSIIAAWLSEIEVSQLEHSWHILYRRATANALALSANSWADANTLTSKHLAQRNSIELTYAALSNTTG